MNLGKQPKHHSNIHKYCMKNLIIFKFEPTTPNIAQHPATCVNMSQHGGQTRTTSCAQLCSDMLRWNIVIVWPGLYTWQATCKFWLLTEHNKHCTLLKYFSSWYSRTMIKAASLLHFKISLILEFRILRSNETWITRQH